MGVIVGGAQAGGGYGLDVTGTAGQRGGMSLPLFASGETEVVPHL